MLAWLNEYRALLHLLLHVVVPGIFARVLSGWPIGAGFQIRILTRRFTGFWAILICLLLTMVVDVDHLLASPMYAPNRCSILFHPLHQSWAIVVYGVMVLWPLGLKLMANEWRYGHGLMAVLGMGLLIHMLLDGLDCLWMQAC